MIPFAEPYRAPDGSERRSLWTRVPETRPPNLTHEPGGCWHETVAFDAPISDTAASALARVAVEDWLLKQNCALHHWDDLWKVRLPTGMIDKRYTWTTNHSTANAALNAAAHAVADAKGVEP